MRESSSPFECGALLGRAPKQFVSGYVSYIIIFYYFSRCVKNRASIAFLKYSQS
jgi:hypothetical protein